MPVLANVLLAARDNKLSVTGTDLEVELVATCAVSVQQPGDITVPGRKLLDIFRSLPEKVPHVVGLSLPRAREAAIERIRSRRRKLEASKVGVRGIQEKVPFLHDHS